ncbi:MAG TPA: asparaginase [Streptosporangiaceae bacterium]|nr:asparaginase [Streptosporangiaceae bacterium]
MTDSAQPGLPVLAEVVRSGFTESWHTGSLIALDAGGRVVMSLGVPDQPCFPRSSAKPLQAAAMVRAGLDVPDDLLALACASHSGEDMHTAGVRRLLATAGLDERALQCPPDLPRDEEARQKLADAGGGPERIYMNCSGKHAGMLATCVTNGWPVDSYRDPGHPLQRAIRETIEELAGEKVAHTGVDGCGAPLFAFSLTGLARAFRAIITAEPGTAERRVADAFRAFPELTSGTKRPEAALMRGVSGLLNKGGAEAVDAAALPDGSALAVKIADGGPRARVPVTVAALRVLGVTAPVLDDLESAPVLGGGAVVGTITASPAIRPRTRQP